MLPPVVAIVGHSGAGKTTFIESLLPELARRGYCVATIKHVPRHLELGGEGKDSQRHLAAGSRAVLLSAPDMVVVQRPVASEMPLPALVKMLGEDYDLVLAEGFKEADAAKIEVYRQGVGPPLAGLGRLVAVVSDKPLTTKARLFATGDVSGVADLLETGFILPNRERLNLYVNGAAVPLKAFPARIMTNVLLAMVESLEGVADLHRLEVSFSRPATADLKKDARLGYKMGMESLEQKDGLIGQEETA